MHVPLPVFVNVVVAPTFRLLLDLLFGGVLLYHLPPENALATPPRRTFFIPPDQNWLAALICAPRLSLCLSVG